MTFFEPTNVIVPKGQTNTNNVTESPLKPELLLES